MIFENNFLTKQFLLYEKKIFGLTFSENTNKCDLFLMYNYVKRGYMEVIVGIVWKTLLFIIGSIVTIGICFLGSLILPLKPLLIVAIFVTLGATVLAVFAVIGFFRLDKHPVKKWYSNVYLLFYSLVLLMCSGSFSFINYALQDLYRYETGAEAAMTTEEKLDYYQQFLSSLSEEDHKEFPSIQKGNITYYYNTSLQEANESIAKFETVINRRQEEFFAYFNDQSKKPLTVVFYQHKNQIANIDSNLAAFYKPANKTIHIPVDSEIQLIAHEYVHHLFHSLAEDMGVDIFEVPMWLNEGVSNSLQKNGRGIEVFSLTNYEMVNFNKISTRYGWNTHLTENANANPYEQSGAIVDTLLHQFGVDFIRKLFTEMKSNDFETAFANTTGMSLEQYTNNFIEVVKSVKNDEIKLNELEGKQQYDDAIHIVESIIDIIPNDHLAYHRLALLYKAKGDYESAIRYHQKSVELNPDNVNSYWYLSQTQLLLDVNEAVATIKKGIEINNESDIYHQNYYDILVSIQKETKNPYKDYLRLITEEYFYGENEVRALIESVLKAYPDIYSNERTQMESILAELK